MVVLGTLSQLSIDTLYLVEYKSTGWWTEAPAKHIKISEKEKGGKK
jgi:hypothetical protein